MDRAFGLGYRLGFSCSLTFQGHVFDRERPFPKFAAETLDNREFNILVLQLLSFSAHAPIQPSQSCA